MSFWPDLTKAYRRTLNKKYAEEWIWQFRDFYRVHPLNDQTLDSLRGLLWLGLDAAIRMNASWPEANSTFLHAPSFTPEDNWHYAWIIHEHGIYLSHYLNFFPGLSGNWATIIARGLYMIGTLYPEFKDAVAWREIAVIKLMDELDHGVTGDGMSAELSTAYHYNFVNSFLSVVEIAERNGFELPAECTSRLVEMYRAPLMIMDQSGIVSPVNDSRPLDAVEQARRALDFADDPVIEWAVSEKRRGEPLPLENLNGRALRLESAHETAELILSRPTPRSRLNWMQARGPDSTIPTPLRRWILFTGGDSRNRINQLFLLDVSDLRPTRGLGGNGE